MTLEKSACKLASSLTTQSIMTAYPVRASPCFELLFFFSIILHISALYQPEVNFEKNTFIFLFSFISV